MSNSDVKILRDELAKIIADNKKKDSVIEKQACVLDEGKKAIAELIMEIDMLKRRLIIYENPHVPPSNDSVPAQQKKARSAKGAKPSEQAEGKTAGIPGRKPGHAGVSHHRRSKETVHHRPDKCSKCGGASISDVRTTTKQIIDIPEMPKAAVVTHVSHQRVCSDCKTVTVPKPPGINGTSLGPNLLALLTSVWGKAVSVGNATTLLNDTFGAGLCKTAVTHALVAASGKLQKTAGEINVSILKSQYIKMDETPIRFNGKRQYVWACVGDEGVAVTVGTRSTAEIDCHFLYYDKPITCDGYPAYNVFHTRQRCWAHILRESEFIMYDKKTNQMAAMLHHKLQELYHEAKLEPPDIGDAHQMELVCRAWSVAKAYVGLDDRFSILLWNAVPDLFTFIRYPCMDPTNNESERMLRKVAIHRKIRQKLVTVGGKIMFGTIMTCLLTWDKQGLNWFEKLSKTFWAT